MHKSNRCIKPDVRTQKAYEGDGWPRKGGPKQAVMQAMQAGQVTLKSEPMKGVSHVGCQKPSDKGTFRRT